MANIPESRRLYPNRKPDPPDRSHRYSYMLSPATVAELQARGIEFVAADIGGDGEESERIWPALRMGGKLILIGADPHGSGPGVLMEGES